MTYSVGNNKYYLSYNNLQERYLEVVNYTDEQFKTNIIEILHLACIISYFKELPAECTISDEGIIHQLVHLMHIPNEPLIDLTEIRNQFNTLLKLA